MIYDNITALIGKTPMLALNNIKNKLELYGNIIAKLEYLNPCGSIKDRAAKYMIDAAIKDGKLSFGGTVIEATSGNTGIGLSGACASMGYKAVIVMPDNMSVERINIIKALGGEVILTEASLGMGGAIKKAEEIHKNTPNSIIAGQFDNVANVEAHYKTTGVEIYEDMCGDIDFLVCGVGTGGTVTGTGKYLKEQNPKIKVIGVEPASSPYLSRGNSGIHKIQGIGAGFVPSILDVKLLDEIICVSDNDAVKYAQYLSRCEGVMCGISSGAALCAAIELAKKKENKDKNIVVIFPDSADRYYSTELFDN